MLIFFKWCTSESGYTIRLITSSLLFHKMSGRCEPKEYKHELTICAPREGTLRCPAGQQLVLKGIRWGRPPVNSSQWGKCRMDRRPCAMRHTSGKISPTRILRFCDRTILCIVW